MDAADTDPILRHFALRPDALLGEGGEAQVYALDERRVLRVPRGGSVANVDARVALLEECTRASADIGVALPRVVDVVDVAGRRVVVEDRLPGRPGREVLADPATDRERLVRSYLGASDALRRLPVSWTRFGRYGEPDAPTDTSLRSWAAGVATRSLAKVDVFDSVDGVAVTDEFVDALAHAGIDVTEVVLVHLDAFLGNMLAEDDEITAVLDFGAVTSGAVAGIDPLASAAYLDSEITTEATDADRAVARTWLAERGLLDAEIPTRRWVACLWAFAPEDEHLHRWCRRQLGI